MIQSMMGFVTLPISFWRYALETIYYILNKVLSKSVNKTPYEIWSRCKPVLSYLRIWRCPAYVKRLKTDKLRPRSDKCLFVRYSKDTKGYHFYLTEEQKVFISNRTVFLEKKFFGKGTNATKIKLSEVCEVEIPTYTKSDLIGETNLEPVEMPLRRSDRVSYQPDRYYSFLVQDDDPIKLDENDEDPITYMDAIERFNS